jgi:AbrB family looped-hinge helix DNA binding protein
MTLPLFKIYGTAMMNTKGQVVIPAAARNGLNWKPGMRFVIMGIAKKRAIALVRAEDMERYMAESETNSEHFSTRIHEK